MVIDFFQKGVIRNSVNLPSVDFETYQKQKPYLDLLEKTGSFQGQTIEGGIKEINLTYAGEISGLGTTVLTMAYLKGLLTPILGPKVNLVNAEVIAKERGIKILKSKSNQSEDYTSLFNAVIKTDKSTLTISSTLFSHQKPRIVNINGLDIDIAPQGCMLLLENIDRPGVIGKTGTVLAAENINIASMQVGRRSMGGEVITVVTVDEALSRDVLEKISRIDGVSKVKFVQL